MTHLTDEETSILRRTLGLGKFNRTNPTRNQLWMADAGDYLMHIELLIERGYMTTDSIIGPKGKRFFYKATDAGRVAVLDMPWKV